MKHEYRYRIFLQNIFSGEPLREIEVNIYASYQSIANSIYKEIRSLIINLDCYPTEVN